LADLGLNTPFALLAPDQADNGWHYTLYIESVTTPDLGERLELALCENPQYGYCRELGQLGPVRIFAIFERGYEVFSDRLVTEGKCLGAIKPTALCNTKGWSKSFLGQYIPFENHDTHQTRGFDSAASASEPT
jgi:GH3 auxin-responsive promoter